MINLARIWYSDSNALVRQKVDEAVFERRAPLLAEIVHQGVREGNFTTAYPEQASEILLSLLQGMGNIHAKLLLSLDPERPVANGGHDGIGDHPESAVERIVAVHAAYMDAVERVC